MALPEGYVELLGRLAKALGSYRQATGRQAVIVGGAAAALYTDGAFMTGDVDIIAGDDGAFHDALIQHGFRREDRLSRQKGGFYHPDLPGYGVEQVSAPLFDGMSDPERLVVIEVASGDTIVLPAIEDLIADRLGQHAVFRVSDDSRLQQARILYDLADAIDHDYLRKRVAQDGGNIALLDVGLA